jgi:anti-sigma factor (TIGR02949 family)
MEKVSMGNGACEQVRGSLDAYISNEVDERVGRRVADHLAHCPSCSAEWEARNRLRTRLKAAVERQSVPPELRAKITGRLAARQARSWLNTGWSRWALAAAATAGVAAVTIAVVNNRRLPLPALADGPAQESYIQTVSSTLAAVLKVGLGDHIHCSVFRKYLANPPAAQEMAQKLGPAYAGLLPLLRATVPQEYRVIMAHQCGYAGRKYIHLTMQKGTELVSVVIARKEPGESLSGLPERKRPAGIPVYQSAADQYEIAGFEAGGYLAFVVSAMRGRANLEIATNLAPALHEFLMKAPV